jgi:HK97 family phage prohead protease
MTEIEHRGGIPAEIRSDDTGTKVSGYASVFGQAADIGGMWSEVIERGAFSEAIGRDDVVFLINHEGLPLARTRSKTLVLREDDHGLYMETMLDPNDPDVQSIVPKMKRGDLDKMSFAFRSEVQEWDDTQDPPLRTIKKASLYDVSIVTTPAFDGTSIGLRSLAEHRDALAALTEAALDAAKALKEITVQAAAPVNKAAATRARLKMSLDLKVRTKR